jgi:integrase
MAIYKRGKVYWYKFQWNGMPVRESTKQGNDKIARKMEAAHRTRLAEGLVGIREKKAVPKFNDFAQRIEDWAKVNVSPGGFLWYRAGLRALKAYRPIAALRLDEITGEHASSFAAHELKREQETNAKKNRSGMSIGSINSELRVLRRVLRLAAEWNQLERIPKIKLLPRENHRDRVITPEQECLYLAHAREPLASVATVLVDSGLRPDECYRLRWEAISWINGRRGTLRVRKGKTKAACRVLPLTQRVRELLESRWENSGRPQEGWIWPSDTASGHIERGTLKHPHRTALKDGGIQPFVLYSLRHTFLTRLGASGCDVWTLARIAGHSSIAISARYVHPNDDGVFEAMGQMAGHNSGHITEIGRSNQGRETLIA